jgi:two-component system chemotaxis response regulator CheB
MSLEGRTPLALHLAERDAEPQSGHVYFGVGGKHIGVGHGGRVVVTPNPQQIFLKPSVDVLFYTAAQAFGRDVVAVVLSGLSIQLDGVAGAQAVKAAQGLVIALDDPANPYLGLPKSVIDAGAATHVCTMPDLARTLVRAAAGS